MQVVNQQHSKGFFGRMLASLSDKIQLLSMVIGRSRLVLFFLSFLHFSLVPIVAQAALTYLMAYVIWGVLMDWMVHQNWFKALRQYQQYILLSLLYIGYTVMVIFELEPTCHLAVYLGMAIPMLWVMLLSISAVLVWYYGSREIPKNEERASPTSSDLSCHIINLFLTLLYAILYIGDTYVYGNILALTTVVTVSTIVSGLMMLYIYGEYHRLKAASPNAASPNAASLNVAPLQYVKLLGIQAMTLSCMLGLVGLIGWSSMTYSTLILLAVLSYTIGHAIDLTLRVNHRPNLDFATQVELVLPHVLNVVMAVQLVLYTRVILLGLQMSFLQMLPILLPLTLLSVFYMKKEYDVCHERLQKATQRGETLLARILRFICTSLHSCFAPLGACFRIDHIGNARSSLSDDFEAPSSVHSTVPDYQDATSPALPRLGAAG